MLSFPAISVRLLGASILLEYAVIAHPTVEVIKRDSSPPSLIDALQNAAKVSCNDPTFADPVNSDAGDQWDQSGAQDLWLAIVWHWQSTSHGNYKDLTELVAETLGVGQSSASFDCGDFGDNNGCTGYAPSDPKCNQQVGPAGMLILDSLSNINNFFMNVNETLSQAKTNALGSVGDVVNGFVEFNKPAIQASELALGIISALIMPIGAGQMLSKSVASGVGNLIKGIGSKTKGYEQLGSKQASYVTSKLNDYKVMANQLGFEASTTVEDLLAAAKNPIDNVQGILNEIATFDDLVVQVTDQWAGGAQGAIENIFSGNGVTDVITNGISNYDSLTNMLKDGKWNLPISVDDAAGDATTIIMSELLPLALLQNDKVRPVLVIRPYNCGDQEKSKQDSGFTGMFQPFGSDDQKQAAISLPDHQDICMFMLDANQDLSKPCSDRGCTDQKYLQTLLGMVNSEISGSATYGGLTLEAFASSLYEAWVTNGRQNGVPPFQINKNAPPSDPANLYDNPVSAPGLYNSVFTVCGSDDTTSTTSLEKSKDMQLISNNVRSAHDWTFANMTLGYPCRPNPPRRRI